METATTPDVSSTLAQWLAWLEYLHPAEIELGLERVREVAARAGLFDQLPVVVSVAGTNGKGSVVAMLTAMYGAAGYRVGSYTSPHITLFNERICINGTPAEDASIITALAAIEPHRAQQSLTYFEYTTLAAMQLFKGAMVDVVILEVGLGGRLDAVNIWDADCALVTSIAIDHESWLGSDRASIAVEKAGIARAGKALVVGDADAPASLLEYAGSINAHCLLSGVDFYWREESGQLRLRLPARALDLPLPALSGRHQCANAATAVTALETLQHRLPVPDRAIAEGLQLARVAGRFERRQSGGVEIIIDVAHNPAAAAALAQTLAAKMPDRRAHAVIGIMADKDVAAIITELAPAVTSWHVAELPVNRAMPAAQLAAHLKSLQPCDNIEQYASVRQALAAALASAHATESGAPEATTGGLNCQLERAKSCRNDYVLVCGSFFTVAEMQG